MSERHQGRRAGRPATGPLPPLWDEGRPIVNDAAAPILRRARDAALLHDRRLQVAFDRRTGTYRLAVVRPTA